MLSAADRKQIEDKIAAVETQSAAEIVVATVERCGDYALYRGMATAFLVLVAGAALLYLRPATPAVELLALQLPMLVAVYLLSGMSLWVRAFVPASVRDTAARSRALQMFVERGVHETRDRSGVLVLISMVERRVVILGDSGIHARVKEVGWEAYCKTIIDGLRIGQPAPAIVRVLEELGVILARDFPARPDDRNELPNTVR